MLALSANCVIVRPQDVALEFVSKSVKQMAVAIEDFANLGFPNATAEIVRANSLMELITFTYGSPEEFVREFNEGLTIVVSENDYRSALALVTVLLGNTYELSPGQSAALLNKLYLSDVLCYNQNYSRTELTESLAHFRMILPDAKLTAPLEVDFALALESMKAGSTDIDTHVAESDLPKLMLSWIINATINPLLPAQWIDPDAFDEMFEDHDLLDHKEQILALEYDLQWEGMEDLTYTLLQNLDGMDVHYAKELASLQQCWALFKGEVSFSQWLATQPAYFKKYMLMHENKYNLYLLDRSVLAA